MTLEHVSFATGERVLIHPDDVQHLVLHSPDAHINGALLTDYLLRCKLVLLTVEATPYSFEPRAFSLQLLVAPLTEEGMPDREHAFNFRVLYSPRLSHAL